MKRKRSQWESLLELHMRERGLRPAVEYVFAPPRKWRLDFAFPSERVAVEVEGGIWTRGRHSRGYGVVGDIEKYNALALAGFLLIRCTPAMVQSLEAVRLVEQALEMRRAA